MIIVIWEKGGNREKNQVFRGFAAFLLLGENWHKGQKPPISAAFVALPDSFAFVACVRSIVKPKVSIIIFLSSVAACHRRRAILDGVRVLSSVQANNGHARGGWLPWSILVTLHTHAKISI
jgi:hypothetical protein